MLSSAFPQIIFIEMCIVSSFCIVKVDIQYSALLFHLGKSTLTLKGSKHWNIALKYIRSIIMKIITEKSSVFQIVLEAFFVYFMHLS